MTIRRFWRGMLCFLTFGSVAMAAPVVQVTVHVVDEQGQSIKTKGGLKFSYYLNPDGTPNLKHDRSQNLFDQVYSRQKTLQEIL